MRATSFSAACRDEGQLDRQQEEEEEGKEGGRGRGERGATPVREPRHRTAQANPGGAARRGVAGGRQRGGAPAQLRRAPRGRRPAGPRPPAGAAVAGAGSRVMRADPHVSS